MALLPTPPLPLATATFHLIWVIRARIRPAISSTWARMFDPPSPTISAYRFGIVRPPFRSSGGTAESHSITVKVGGLHYGSAASFS